jgi:excisionase family DNA binding protein
MTPTPARRWITVQEAAEFTCLRLRTVRDMISCGVIRAVRLGRSIRVDLQAFEKRDAAQIPAAKFKAGGRPC